MRDFYVAVGIITAVIISFASGIYVQGQRQADRDLGLALPQGTALFETSLQDRITSSDTSMSLVSASVPGGESISGYNCFIIDEGRSDREFVCGTVSGTTVSSLERGLSFTNGTSTVAALKFAHRKGANVKITDFPLIQRIRNQANGVETFPNLLTYDTDVFIDSSSATSSIVTKYYVDNVAVAGASDATEIVKGIVELASGAEAAAGTSAGGTGARLAIPSSIGTSTCQASGFSALLTAAGGKLAQSCMNLTEHFGFTSLFATSASSTNATTTNMWITSVASSLLKTDSNGKVQAATAGVDYARPQYTYATSTNNRVTNAFATSTFLGIPANTLTASSSIRIRGQANCDGSGGTATCNVFIRDEATSATYATCAASAGSGAQTSLNFEVTILGNNSASSQRNYCNGVALQGGSASNAAVYQNEATSAIDLTAAVRFSVVIQGASATSQTTLENYSIIVQP